MKKQNKNGEIMRYKTWFVARWFSQRPKMDFDETYPSAVDSINFLYLISLITHEEFYLNMMDIVTTYLYDSLDSDIYIKLSKEFNISKIHNFGSRESYFIKLNKSLHELIQYEHMCYNCLSEYLLREIYK